MIHSIARLIGLLVVPFPAGLRTPRPVWAQGLVGHDVHLHVPPHEVEVMRSTCEKPLSLPLRVEMTAGHPSPRSITPWKVAAVRICWLDRELSAADFKGTPVSARTFVDRGWMVVSRREGRAPFWTLTEHPGRPDLAYPEIVRAIQREAAETA